jgi:hypothetical protein
MDKMNITKKQSSRFWNYVEVSSPDECWPWIGGTIGGYGSYKIGSVKDGSRRNEYSHRISCQLAHGAIPAGSHVLHACDFKLCCNPAHLEVGTCSKNHKDAWARGLRRGPKLSADDVVAIRASSKRNKDIAVKYDIHPRYVSEIRNYHCWVRDDMQAAGLAS